MFNPFAAWPVTGTWADHMSYSLGGIDQPLGYGTPIRAPAAGTLRTSGGSGEYRAGLVGTAGRRAILTLRSPVLSLFAIALQHLSRFAPEGDYEEGDIIGWSGASTIRSNGTVNEYGGDVHLHHHGLTKDGTRIDWRGFLGYAPATSSVAASNTTALPALTEGDDDMRRVKNTKSNATYLVGREFIHHLPDANYISATDTYGAVLDLDETKFHALTDSLSIPWKTIPTVGPGAGWSVAGGLTKYNW